MTRTVLAVACVSALAAGGASAQTAEPARGKPAYTDDDLERYRREREAGQPKPKTQASPAAPAAAPGGSSPEASPGDAVPEEDGASDPRAAITARIEEKRRELKEAEAARDKARERVAEIEARLDPMTMRFELDPNAMFALQAELPEARAALEQSEAKVAQARREVAEAERAARLAGVPVPR